MSTNGHLSPKPFDTTARQYDALFDGLVDKYPNIRNGDYKRWYPWPNQPTSRVACFDFTASGPPKESRFQDAQGLRSFLELPSRAGSRRLFILESFNEEIRDLVCVKLGVDPQMFYRHARVAMWESSRHHAGNTPLLPSLIDADRSWSLAYSQLMRLNLEKQEFTLRCAGSERHIASSRIDGKLDGVGSVSRKISFSAVRRDLEGWDVVLLVDEPFRRAICGTKQQNQFAKGFRPPEPWQGGYNDFIKYPTTKDAAEAPSPPRTSTFDDLCFYHTSHSRHLNITSDPRSVTMFAQKLVASEYMLLIEYNRYLLCHLGWKLSRRNSFEIFESNWIEMSWSDLSSFYQRIQGHRRNVSLAIADLDLQNKSATDWMSTARDYQFIEAQFVSLQQRAEGLLNSFTGLAGMVGNRQSLQEAHSVGVLTILGMVFVPLSLVASLFSMSDDYRPGRGDFWVYFAVSLPIAVMVFLVASVAMRWRSIWRMVKTWRDRGRKIE